MRSFDVFSSKSYPVWLGYYLDSASYTYNWMADFEPIDFSQFDSTGYYQVIMPARPSLSAPVYYGYLNATLTVTKILFVEVSYLNIIFNSVNSASPQFSLICSKCCIDARKSLFDFPEFKLRKMLV